MFQGGVSKGPISTARTPSTPASFGTFGLDGNPALADRVISPANPFVSDKLLNALASPLASGPFELRYYWFASATVPDFDDAYVNLPMTYNAATGAWSVLPPPVETALSLTASASGSTVTLSASVKRLSDGTAATAATGQVVFREGASVVGTVPTTNGAASLVLVGVTTGAHSYEASFEPDFSFGFSASDSLPATVTVSGSQTAPVTTSGNIEFQVAAGVGGGALVLTASSLTANLGPVVRTGGVLTASGTVTAVVDDSRQSNAPAFLLTGQVADFTDGAKVLSSRYLGWTPSVTGVGTAGPIVVGGPVVTDGLLGTKTWATGTPSAADPQPTTTSASAILQLRAPLNTASGNYSALMTVTLT